MAQAVYTWTDEQGVVHYGDKPADPHAKQADLPPLQTMPAEQVMERKTAPASSESTSMPAPKLRMTAPAPDETVRGAERQFQVSAALDGDVPPGAKFVFYLDGSARETGASPATTFTGVDRGSHWVTVALVGAGNKELVRADPVLVHVKPPTVNKP